MVRVVKDVLHPTLPLPFPAACAQVVREGEDVLLSCKAGGHPMPRIKWRREDGSTIRQGDGRQGRAGQ